MAYLSKPITLQGSLLLLYATKILAIQTHTMTSTALAQKATSVKDVGVPFNQTCHLGSFAFDAANATLGLYCNNDDWAQYDYDWTYLDLDHCVGNNGGFLIPYPGGNFSTSCQNCNVTWSHVYLSPVTSITTQSPTGFQVTTMTTVSTPRWDDLYLGCGGCLNMDGGMQSATVDLNEVVTNNDGTVGCYTYTGNALSAQPKAPSSTPTPAEAKTTGM